jgi:signal-transduction protein with cAMP-binding, CBS, and nucleotidyltransferase domain
MTAAEVMTRNVYTVAEDENVTTAMRLMEENKVRRLPVTRGGKIVGILSVADFSTHLPESKIGQLVTAVSRPVIEMAVPAP